MIAIYTTLQGPSLVFQNPKLTPFSWVTIATNGLDWAQLLEMDWAQLLESKPQFPTREDWGQASIMTRLLWNRTVIPLHIPLHIGYRNMLETLTNEDLKAYLSNYSKVICLLESNILCMV